MWERERERNVSIKSDLLNDAITLKHAKLNIEKPCKKCRIKTVDVKYF